MFGKWNSKESCQSSTWRELEAVKRVFCYNLDKVVDKSIQVVTDNKNVKHIRCWEQEDKT